MSRHPIAPAWDRFGLPIAFFALLALSLYTTRHRVWTVEAIWTLPRSLIFFYMVWRVIRISYDLINLCSDLVRRFEAAIQRLEDRDQTRLTVLHSAEDYAKALETELRLLHAPPAGRPTASPDAAD